MKRLICSLVLASGGLFTTALIPTKANAATLTVTPNGEIPKNPFDLVSFTYVLTPTLGSVLTIRNWGLSIDDNELSGDILGGPPLDASIVNALTFRSFHEVRIPVREGGSDLRALLIYDESSQSGNIINQGLLVDAGNIVPFEAAPEPVTLFGTATALGLGVLFKRKSSKKTVS